MVVVPPSHYRAHGVVIGNHMKIFKSGVEFASDYNDERSLPRFWAGLPTELAKFLINFDE